MGFVGDFIQDVFGIGETQQTTQVIVPPPSQRELQIQDQNLKLSEAQLAAFNSALERQNALWDIQRPLLEADARRNQMMESLYPMDQQVADARSALGLQRDSIELQRQLVEQARRTNPIQEELQRLQLEAIRRGGKASPEELATINQIIESQIAAGSADVDRFMDEGLRQIREELAPSRGLRSTDSPIVDRGFQLGAEGTRMKGQITNSLRAAGAQAQLDYPLAKMSAVGAQSQFQQNLNQSILNFQAQLKQQAEANRQSMALGINSGSSGLIGSVGSPFALEASQGNFRLGSAGRNVNNSGMGWQDFGQVMRGVGAVMASDLLIKENIKKVAIHKLGFGIYEFNYVGDDETRLGVMAQEVQQVVPEAVTRHPDGYLVVDYSRLVQ